MRTNALHSAPYGSAYPNNHYYKTLNNEHMIMDDGIYYHLLYEFHMYYYTHGIYGIPYDITQYNIITDIPYGCGT